MRIELFGNLPFKYNKFLDRKKICKMFNLNYKQLAKAYNNWIQIFRIKESNLTFEQYLLKLKETNINPDNIGNKRDQYNLARYNDIGPYTAKNCRFITRLQNENEQIKMSLYCLCIEKYGIIKTKEMMSNNGKKGGLNNKNKPKTEQHKQNIKNALIKKNKC